MSSPSCRRRPRSPTSKRCSHGTGRHRRRKASPPEQQLVKPKSILSFVERLQSFESGRYELTESRQLPKFLREGDRLLELGGGVGFISTLSSRVARLSSCTVIEANPDLIDTIQTTHRRNNVTADVRNAVALSDRGRAALGLEEAHDVAFYLRKSFWGSSLSPKAHFDAKVMVPILDFQTLIADVRPTVIVADIEGGEETLFDGILLEGVRHVYVEVHKHIIGLAHIGTMIAALARQGLFYDPEFSTGAVVMLSRP